MRRAIAILLAALFSFSLLTPLLLADARTQLPSCCRRGGTHRCAAATNAQTSTPTFAARCSLYASTHTVLHLTSGIAPASRSHSLSIPVTRAAALRFASPVHTAFSGASFQRRGPPSLLQ